MKFCPTAVVALILLVIPYEGFPNSLGTASSLIAQGKLEESIVILSQIYRDSPDSSEEQFDAALVLSSFGPGTTAYSSRQLYAQSVLFSSFANERLSASDRVRLLRRMGLGWFSRAQWAESAKAFEDLLAEGDVLDRALAEMYLGWIEMNLKHPRKAAHRWLNLLMGNPEDLEPQWRGPVLRDLGRAWIESGEFQSSHLNNSVSQLAESLENQNSLSEGIKQGLFSIGENPTRAAQLRGQLTKTLAGNTLSVLITKLFLKNSEILREHPCEILDWIPIQLAQEKESKLSLLNSLQSCLQVPEGSSEGSRAALLKILSWIRNSENSTLPSEDPLFSDLINFVIENENSVSARQELLERVYPDPTEIGKSGKTTPLLLWLGILADSEKSPQSSEARQRWVDYFLGHLDIFKNLPLSQEDAFLIVLQMSQQENLPQPLWRQTKKLEETALKSVKARLSYQAWLTGLITSRFFIKTDGTTQREVQALTAPDKGTLAESYFKLATFLASPSLAQNIYRKRNIHPTFPIDVYIKESPFLMAAKSICESISSFEKAHLMNVSLRSPRAMNVLQRKLKLAQAAALQFRKAVIIYPLFQDQIISILAASIEGVQSDVERIKVPSSWPVVDKETWNAQQSEWIAQIELWKVL